MPLRILFIIRGLEAGEPLGIMHISALLRRAGHEVKFLNTRGVDLLRELRSFDPLIVGYGACTGEHNYYLALNRHLKEQQAFIAVFGGPHATFFPDIINEAGVDIVCRGEGEYPMLDLCQCIEAGRAYTDIPNLWVKSAGGISRNPVRPLVADLDSLPWPDRQPRYDADPRSRQYAAQSFITSRGCPHSCAYCFNPSMRELCGPAWAKVRVRSPENVVAEIEQVKATSSLSFAQFRCSVFPSDEGWLEEFARAYSQRIALPFYCHVRADDMSERVVELLAAAGCRSVNMGIECADERYRREVLRRPMSNDDIRAACRRLHAHRIAILADNIIGLPRRGFEDDIETLRLNAECGVDYPLAMLLQPYPGTAIADYAIENGYFDGDYSRIDYNYYHRSPLRFGSDDERRRIENLQKFFALAADCPSLLPLVKRLVRLPGNLLFASVFRSWFLYCYHRRIMPHRLSMRDLMDIVKVLFGIYPRESFHAPG